MILSFLIKINYQRKNKITKTLEALNKFLFLLYELKTCSERATYNSLVLKHLSLSGLLLINYNLVK